MKPVVYTERICTVLYTWNIHIKGDNNMKMKITGKTSYRVTEKYLFVRNLLIYEHGLIYCRFESDLPKFFDPDPTLGLTQNKCPFFGVRPALRYGYTLPVLQRSTGYLTVLFKNYHK